jgi:glycosyltransferase involved in cell wall biosynthesis
MEGHVPMPAVPPDSTGVEVSVVIPCLNEERTVGVCVRKARESLDAQGVKWEVIVCDNGSTDRSIETATHEGAQVVIESRHGYGNAYMTGLNKARGRYIVMGDSDDTYDFTEIPRFLAILRQGYDFVTGTRFGARAIEGMPFLHRYFGNPMLTRILNYLFRTGFSDVYCGMRAFTREAYQRIAPLSPGMEFNLELAINARKAGLRCHEIPIQLHERATPAKLRTLRDGWRSLRFILLYSPNSLFLVPSLGCIFLAAMAFTLAFLLPLLRGPDPWVQLEASGSLLAIVGNQIFQFWLVAKTCSLSERFERENPVSQRLAQVFSLERGLVAGAGLLLLGLAISGWLVLNWIMAGFASQYSRWGYLALTLTAIGAQVICGSFFLSLLTVKREREEASTTHGCRPPQH